MNRSWMTFFFNFESTLRTKSFTNEVLSTNIRFFINFFDWVVRERFIHRILRRRFSILNRSRMNFQMRRNCLSLLFNELLATIHSINFESIFWTLKARSKLRMIREWNFEYKYIKHRYFFFIESFTNYSFFQL